MSFMALKNAHIGLAYLTVALFFLRGLHRLILKPQHPTTMQKTFNYISYAVDIPLFALGITLLAILSINPATTTWMASKLIFLVLYIAIGVFAFRPILSVRMRWFCFAASLLCWVMMYNTVRTHLSFWQWFA